MSIRLSRRPAVPPLGLPEAGWGCQGANSGLSGSQGLTQGSQGLDQASQKGQKWPPPSLIRFAAFLTLSDKSQSFNLSACAAF